MPKQQQPMKWAVKWAANEVGCYKTMPQNNHPSDVWQQRADNRTSLVRCPCELLPRNSFRQVVLSQIVFSSELGKLVRKQQL